MRKFKNIMSIIGWILAIFFVGQWINANHKIDKLQETITRQGFAIESLEKQKSSAIYTPKYLDSIPDYDQGNCIGNNSRINNYDSFCSFVLLR